MRRVITAREQVGILSPWLVEALDVDPRARPPGVPGGGRQPVLPPERPLGPSHEEAPEWAQHDWRTADDYGAFHSKARPPMSSDIPHPSELKLSTKPRSRTIENEDGTKSKQDLPSWADQAANSEDPDNDPWGMLTGTPWTFEDLVQNHISHHDNMTPEEAFQGKVWYPAAHDSTKDVAEKTTGDQARTVALDSSLSPVKDWDLNNEQMIHYMLNYQGQEGFRTKPKGEDAPENDPENRFRVKAPDSQNDKAHQIMNAPKGTTREEYLAMLGGPKTGSFMNNILDDTPLREPRPGHEDDEGYYQHEVNPHTGEPDWRFGDQDVTADTHHARVQTIPHGADLSQIKYETPPHFQDKLTLNKKEIYPGYDLHARASAEATRRINLREQDPERHLKPKQAQAGPWTKFKSDVIAAGVSPNMPEPGTAPKSFNPDKPSSLKGLYPGESDQPRYQRDLGDWVHPGRPDPNIRSAPNYLRRSMRTFVSSSGWLDDWVSQKYPHKAAPAAASERDPIQAALEAIAYSDGVVGRL